MTYSILLSTNISTCSPAHLPARTSSQLSNRAPPPSTRLRGLESSVELNLPSFRDICDWSITTLPSHHLSKCFVVH